MHLLQVFVLLFSSFQSFASEEISDYKYKSDEYPRLYNRAMTNNRFRGYQNLQNMFAQLNPDFLV
ncbi:unnamed protein product [Oikopleura dioica]|uniref:Uncharacterized protein n=1 Tax=Oikopleura dioica TaxID=34765 RepID=E4WSX5_OIKDI|nr:unnamed protein product [Oikopleura dioica]